MAEKLPLILVVGSSGVTGRLIVDQLDQRSSNVRLRLTSRDPDEVDRLRARGRDAVLLDLDDPMTFPAALHGVDRAYLLTGYTVAMLAQSKTFVDAARKAGVAHIVHQGVFGNWDCTDPHFAWHQLVETYIEASGIPWTHIHPNVFMEQLATVMKPQDNVVPVFWGDRRVGWCASQDLARMAATVLAEGPGKHHGRTYFLSSEVAGGAELAELLSAKSGSKITWEDRPPEELPAAIATLGGGEVETWYAEGSIEFLREVRDGRMGYIATQRDDGPFVTGLPSTTLKDWIDQNADRIFR